jgi:excisionase family DNA binding protein
VSTIDLHELARALAPLIAEQAQPSPLLDADQAGELLNVKPTWVAEQARKDRVPHVKLGHYVRFNRDELLAWVDSRTVGPRA